MSKYFDFLTNHVDDYYIFIGGRDNGKTIYTIRNYLEYLLGGICEYQFDAEQMIHHYLIRNDDIGFMDITVSNPCFINENLGTRLIRMCEEYDAYMRYKYRDYMCRKEKEENVKNNR